MPSSPSSPRRPRLSPSSMRWTNRPWLHLHHRYRRKLCLLLAQRSPAASTDWKRRRGHRASGKISTSTPTLLRLVLSRALLWRPSTPPFGICAANGLDCLSGNLLEELNLKSQSTAQKVVVHIPTADLVQDALARKAEGFGGCKVKVGSAHVAEDVERLQAVREAVGPTL